MSDDTKQKRFLVVLNVHAADSRTASPLPEPPDVLAGMQEGLPEEWFDGVDGDDWYLDETWPWAELNPSELESLRGIVAAWDRMVDEGGDSIDVLDAIDNEAVEAIRKVVAAMTAVEMEGAPWNS